MATTQTNTMLERGNGAQQKAAMSLDEQRAATRRILERVRSANGLPDTTPPGAPAILSDKVAKMAPKSYRSRAIFWLSQVGAFAEALMKGRYNNHMAVRVYEMVQSIT